MKCFLFLISILTVLLSGCSGAERAALNHADALMEERPDSALRILQSIERTNLSGRDLPYYALLMTQAMVKNDIPVASDSLIAIAYDKYGDDWRGDRGIRSNFYMGEILFNQEKNREAMKYYLTAYEESKRLSNDYWHAKAAERIADLFFIAYNYDETIRYRKEAIYYFGLANKSVNQRYMSVELAIAYINCSRNNDALYLLDSVYNITVRENTRDSLLQNFILSTRIDALVALGQTNDLTARDLSLLEEALYPQQNLDNKILKLQIDTENNDYSNKDLIKEIIESASTDEDKALALYACYKHLKPSFGNCFEIRLTDSLLFYQNAIAENIIKESITCAGRDFYSDLAVKNEKQAKQQSQITFIIICSVCLGAFILFLIIRLRTKAHKSEMEAQVEALVNMKVYSDKIFAEKTALSMEIQERTSALTELRKKLELQNSIIIKLDQEVSDNRLIIEDITKEKEDTNRNLAIARDQLEEESEQHIRHIKNLQLEYDSKNKSANQIIENLFRKNWSSLNRLCEEYFEKGSLKKFHELLIKDIEAEVRNIGSTSGLLQIEQELDSYMDGIVSKLKIEYPLLKDKDIILCCLIFAGFSVKAICFILNITTNNFYVRKKRLIQKINDSKTPNTHIFLSHL